MAWSEQSTNNINYNAQRRNQTAWDNGVTLWDLRGNYEVTDWDISSTTYTEASSHSQTWTEA